MSTSRDADGDRSTVGIGRRSPDGDGPAARSGPDRPKLSRGRRIRGLEPEERRQERRRQLLDSAFVLFSGQGYARTSIEQICQGAYVGFKGFYDEFATKEALFLTLYQELVDRISDSVLGVVEDEEFSRGAVRPLLEAFVGTVLDDPRVAQVLFVEAAGLSPAVEAVRRATYRRFAEFLFTMWVGSSLVSEVSEPERVNGHRVALGLVGAIVELMVDWLVDSARRDIGTLVDDLEVFCLVLIAGLDSPWFGQRPAWAPPR